MWTEERDVTVRRATDELRATGLVGTRAVLGAHVERVPRCYPVYARGYARHVATIAAHVASYGGLAAIGRYGAFKYNNQDHSLLMGILAAENCLGAAHPLWSVNTDPTPHESTTTADQLERTATTGERPVACAPRSAAAYADAER
jgi:hypothetical protein